jgi:hypothetical protein
MEEFADFNKYISQIDHYGMRAGIVKVVPPKKWCVRCKMFHGSSG